MTLYRTGNAGFDAAAAAAELTRQTALAGVSSQRQADVISCNYFATVINTGQVFGIETISERVAFETLRCGQLIGASAQPQLFTLDLSALDGPSVLGA